MIFFLLFQSQTLDGLSVKVFLSDGTFPGQSDWSVGFNCLAKVIKHTLEPFHLCCCMFCGAKTVMNF